MHPYDKKIAEWHRFKPVKRKLPTVHCGYVWDRYNRYTLFISCIRTGRYEVRCIANYCICKIDYVPTFLEAVRKVIDWKRQIEIDARILPRLP